MRLTELKPRWIHENMFIFLCPHCQNVWLSVKNIVMLHTVQHALFEKEFGSEGWPLLVVGAEDAYAWNISSKDFNTMTVTPSVDASKSGHWHGNITNGEAQ